MVSGHEIIIIVGCISIRSRRLKEVGCILFLCSGINIFVCRGWVGRSVSDGVDVLMLFRVIGFMIWIMDAAVVGDGDFGAIVFDCDGFRCRREELEGSIHAVAKLRLCEIVLLSLRRFGICRWALDMDVVVFLKHREVFDLAVDGPLVFGACSCLTLVGFIDNNRESLKDAGAHCAA